MSHKTMPLDFCVSRQTRRLHHRPACPAFSGLEILVVIALIAVLIGVMVPALGAARNTGRQMTNSTQLRGIHQSCVIYAQGNKEWFPGLVWAPGPTGATHTPAAKVPWSDRDGRHMGSRLAILLSGNFFTSDYIANPTEQGLVAFDTDQDEQAAGNLLTSAHFSYAGLRFNDLQGELNRTREWSETLNTEAVIMSDRNTDAPHGRASVWPEGEGWSGTVVRNDNSTAFEASHLMEDLRYSNGPLLEIDDLFEAQGPSDAMMTFRQNEAGQEIEAARDVDFH